MKVTRTTTTLAAVALAATLGACQSDTPTKDVTDSKAPSSTSTSTPQPTTSTDAPAAPSTKATASTSIAPNTATKSAPTTAKPTTSPDAGTKCSSSTPAQAARDAAAKVAPEPGPDGQKWKYLSTGAINGWDRCAGLSWIALPLEGGTVSSPWQIALFRHGEYIGTATAEGQGFKPKVTRTSDTGIKVVYAWPKENDANALPTGRSTAYFTWDDARHAVTMTGSIPPSGSAN